MPLLLEMVTFLGGAELAIRKAANLALLRLLKFLLGVVGHSLLFMVVEAQQPTSSTKVSDHTDDLSCRIGPTH